MCATSLFLICGLTLVSQAFARTTDTQSAKLEPTSSVPQSVATSKKTASKITNDQLPSLPETLPNIPTDALQTLSSVHIESAADIDALINEIEKAADEIYESEMVNIQTWSQDQILAPFQSQAEEGLTIARDRLKESAQRLRTKATEAIENARTTMSSEEFSKYMKELQQVIEVELAPTRQYFMDAAEAITQVSKETAARAAARASQASKQTNTKSRASRSQKKNANVQNSVSEVTNSPISAKA